MTDTNSKFHEEAHPEAIQITNQERDYGQWGQCVVDPAKSTGERCTQPAKGSHGKCHTHGGSTTTADENPKQGRGDQDGNDNAVEHGAYRENFIDHLTESEQEMIESVYGDLETAEDAQDVARFVASILLAQFKRSDFDERFARRFESICDKAGIFPAEELEMTADVNQTTQMELGDDEKDIARKLLRERHEQAAGESRDE
ncbi:hypothetical protein PhiCh1p02 [Natrialba phage PhiCh1]|uniref:Virus protein phiCh1-VP1 n=2 Tax=root TaxID=1 RepID=D3T2F0_NATMM|nr:hypothetical protein [Natrialba magadii]NP_665919.1 hypothetical protein PhiCh1p02 [Natrialba phage PhiCh1]YP_010078032.1 uncharacterized protein KMC42_gp02 [Natrialba phage PhiCh1]AAM88676.1 unknown [Natrialba phage PhiCh1]ADD07759.1 virus protein phiCh1-VP1 [Natrialba magadii ATCC 43099]ELY23006.1 hypothetical protein C500_21120 [Natrialba magadii ATCC 43099]QBJ01183.1 uncharacterized protein PhiCh1_005 [Natrialba phage PhiCh1]